MWTVISEAGARAKAYALAHKFLSLVALALVFGGGYWGYATYASTDGETRYVLGVAQKGTIVASISASGQISASNEVDIQPKASGEVTSVAVEKGQAVKAGQLIATIDARAAQKAVRDAETNLETAQLELDKLQEPAEAIDILQAENALAQAKTDLAKSYDSSFNTVADAFLKLPGVMSGLDAILYGTDVSPSHSQDNVSAYKDTVAARDENVASFASDATAKYAKARAAYDAAFLAYRALNRTADKAAIEALAKQSYDATKLIADALKSANDFLGFVDDTAEKYDFAEPAKLATHQEDVSGYISTVNGQLTALLGVTDGIANAEFAIEEKTQQLADLRDGPDALDVRSQQLAIRAREEALQDAREALADYAIRAPFDGYVATLDLAKGDNVGSGSVATLITSQKIATLSVNEVDAAKIEVGDKATLTFDALEDLTLTGTVADIDTVGTVSQGVVSYSLKIAFDTQDDRVKPGMTVNAAIQTDAKQDVLIVPSSAVKTQGEMSYVLAFDPPLSESGGVSGVASAATPIQIPVETGLSDDTNVEILSGLEEGDQIVVRAISGAASTAAAASPGATRTGAGGTRNAGFGGPPGGAVFIQR